MGALRPRPPLAGLAVSLSDPGGPIEAAKESAASLGTVLEAARECSFGDFVQSVADEVAAKAQRRKNPLAGFAPDRRRAHEEILWDLRSVYALLVEKAAPGDVDALPGVDQDGVAARGAGSEGRRLPGHRR